MEVKNNNNKIEQLEQELQKLKQQNSNPHTKAILKEPKNRNIAIIFNIFCDILGGVITAFILNKLYQQFFGKNILVFALLLVFCIAGGFYNSIRIFLKKNKQNFDKK